jgi:acyl transferase domain-containing protein
MLSVPLPAAEVAPLLGGRLSLAAENAPSLSTVSGPVEAIEELAEVLAGRGVQCRRLRTSHAFHSAMMDPVLEPFRQSLQNRTLPNSLQPVSVERSTLGPKAGALGAGVLAIRQALKEL